MIKMIVVDLDGTILNKERKITQITKEYLCKLQEDGYIITIATGRSYSLAMEATDGAIFANYMITNTGACIYDNKKKKLIYKKYLQKRFINRIIRKYSTQMELFRIYTEKTTYSSTSLRGINKIQQVVFLPKDNSNVNCLYDALMKEGYPLNIIVMQDSFASQKWIEIQPLNSTKYNSICRVASMLDIKNDEIIAFGDGLNDVEMIAKSGHGVALKNALEEVKKVSKDITLYDNDNEGVMKYLMNYLK